MSTLVSIVLATVLNMLSHGTFNFEHKNVSQSCNTVQQAPVLQQLNAHYIITKDELLSQM